MPGHVIVRDDDGEDLFLEFFEGDEGIRGCRDVITFPGERFAEAGQNQLFIVHDEQAMHARRGLVSRWLMG
jgi:hypothetical protein